MTDLHQRVTALNRLVATFAYEEAHNRFYADSLVKHENENAPTIGLQRHREEMTVFLSKISDAHAEPLQTIVHGTVTATSWHYRFTHADWGVRDFHQLSVQRWEAGRAVHERHYYSM